MAGASTSVAGGFVDHGPGGGVCVLALKEAQLHVPGGDVGDSVDANVSVAAGEVLLVHAARPGQGSLLADACAGLVAPSAGSVCFMDKDWQRLAVDDINALRSLQGRVFFRGNWLDHLDMIDNVLLAHLHHTRRARSELLQEAASLARHFGLPGLPRGSADSLDRAESQRAACVRAFLGSPRLLVLEHPTAGAFPQLVPPLVNAVRQACARGAAVVWITPSQALWRDESIPVTRRLRIARSTLVEGVSSRET